MKVKITNILKATILITAMSASVIISPITGHANVLDMKDHWGKPAIEQAIKEGWLESDVNYFGTINRINAAMVLGKAIGETQQANFKPKFVDVSSHGKQYPYLAILTERGVFSDVELFNPESKLTRAQAARIIVKAFQLKGTSHGQFKDVPQDAWFTSDVGTLVLNGITTGKSKELFGPHGPVSYMQFVTFIDRAKVDNGKANNEVDLENIEISPEFFNTIMDKNGKSKEQTLKMNVNSKSDLYKAAEKAYTELPKRIQLNTDMDMKVLRDLLYGWKEKTYPKDNINNMTLANYQIERRGVNIYLSDNSHGKYNAIDINRGVQEFAQEFASRSTAETDEEKLLEAYEYVYDNYRYSATGVHSMLIGNMGKDTLACNGFSRLMYELTKAMGLKGEIVRGYEHLWNRVIVDGETVNVDLSTDIYLNEKYLTLGMSTKEHLEVGTRVDIYNTTFDQSIYYSVE